MSYNQPKLSPCAQWDPNGITFADTSEIVFIPNNLFVDRNNTVYVTDEHHNPVYIWHEGNSTRTTITLDDSFRPLNLFVTIDGDIYVASDAPGKVEKWALNATKGIVVKDVSTSCSGLFVDIANYLYCSLADENRVEKQSLNVSTNMLVTVAGNGSSSILYGPHGIFVDTNFDLYVADCWNNRVQLFYLENFYRQLLIHFLIKRYL